MSNTFARLGVYVALVSVCAVSTGCIIQAADGDSEDGGSGGSGEDGGGNAGAAGGAGGSGAADAGGAGGSGGSGGGVNLGDGVGPSGDLRSDAVDVGAHVCAGCPEGVFDTASVDAGTETILDISGKVDGQSGHGQFLVFDDNGQFMGGGIQVDPDSGDFAQTIPLFCGTSTLKVYFTNEAGTSAFVKQITNSGCLPESVRVTVAWDETSRYWVNHLVRFGGTIYDTSADCYASNSCDEGGISKDWGVAGDTTDNPVMDTYARPNFMGVENIYYPEAEDGLKVLIENSGTVDGLTPAGTLYINVHDEPTYVKQIEILKPMEVLIAAKVDGVAGTITPIDEIYDCAATFDLGCEAAIP